MVSGLEWATIAIAGTALLISVLTLYLTVLRRPKLFLMRIPDRAAGASDRSFSEGHWFIHLTIQVAVVNVGARAAVLTGIVDGGESGGAFLDVTTLWVVPPFAGTKLGSVLVPAGEGTPFALEFEVRIAKGNVEALRRSAQDGGTIELSAVCQYIRGRHVLRRRGQPLTGRSRKLVDPVPLKVVADDLPADG